MVEFSLMASELSLGEYILIGLPQPEEEILEVNSKGKPIRMMQKSQKMKLI